MRSSRWTVSLVAFAILVGAGWAARMRVGAGVDMTHAANQFVATLAEKQQQMAVLPYESEARVDWHFIPKAERKGVQVREMSEPQRKAALALLQSCLSEAGYHKATKIMALEHILHVLEGDGRRFARDTQKYYFTLFGKPAEQGKWGLSVEGHHLSLNFVISDGQVVSSTPTFFGANPAIVKNQVPDGQPVGTQLLKKEEELAFALINSLSDEQKKRAIIAEEAFQEIRAAGEPQPPGGDAAGIPVSALEPSQKRAIRNLVSAYIENLPDDVREERMKAIGDAGPANIHFAWAGATKPGIGHYYRIQGPTFLVEFVNTQADPAGNIANHIHCVWRDMSGDFDIKRTETGG